MSAQVEGRLWTTTWGGEEGGCNSGPFKLKHFSEKGRHWLTTELGRFSSWPDLPADASIQSEMGEAFDLSFRLCNQSGQSCRLVLSLNRKSVCLCLTCLTRRNRPFFVAAWTPASHELKRGERQHKDRTEKPHRGSFTPHIQTFKVPFVSSCSKTSGVYTSGYDRPKRPLKESHTCCRVAAPICETSTPSVNTHSPGLSGPRCASQWKESADAQWHCKN